MVIVVAKSVMLQLIRNGSFSRGGTIFARESYKVVTYLTKILS